MYFYTIIVITSTLLRYYYYHYTITLQYQIWHQLQHHFHKNEHLSDWNVNSDSKCQPIVAVVTFNIKTLSVEIISTPQDISNRWYVYYVLIVLSSVLTPLKWFYHLTVSLYVYYKWLNHIYLYKYYRYTNQTVC